MKTQTITKACRVFLFLLFLPLGAALATFPATDDNPNHIENSILEKSALYGYLRMDSPK